MTTKTSSPYLAHVRQNEDGTWECHELEDHLHGTAELASRFAETFGLSDWAEIAALWHDLGKYGQDFQNYIKSASGYEPEAHIETGSGRVNHSSAGALYAIEQLEIHGRILAYLIAGHHAGLPDWHKINSGTGGSLQSRLNDTALLPHALEATIPEDILRSDKPTTPPIGGKQGFALWVRMLFSSLVDADFLDTEEFMDREKSADRGDYPPISELLNLFNSHMERFTADAKPSKVNQLRSQVLAQCREAARQPSGLFSLTVPTGGGKTLSSLAFALEHAIRHGKDRIIYAIPYTSIIEQTADIFRKIFGDSIIEHHSNLDPDKENSRNRLAAENWDAPIIVTTNVQFFESLFAARTSRCRKLHNIANSIVILDEAQLLPPEFLQPILDVMNLLAKHYNVTFVLSTATQPALGTNRDSFGNVRFKGLDDMQEIITDPDDLYSKLERVDVNLPMNFQTPRNWQSIAEELTANESVLAIVNTRKDARELHALMTKGTYHLSAQMCGEHRSNLIAEIKTRLKEGRATRVISTQLVEAGVDLDFPVVYRAMAGLDSIAQAAGRCNREGRLAEKGKMVVFVPPKAAPPGHLRKAAETTVSLLTGFTGNPLSRERFRHYFEQFYVKAPSLDKQDIQSLLTPEGEGNNQLKVQFRTAANRFKLIDESGYQAVLVKYCTEENNAVVSLFGILKKEGPQRWLMRKLQRYSVNIPQYQFKRLLENMEVYEIWPGIYAQCTDTLYHNELGLLTEGQPITVTQLIVE
jgi:CRISPR-associated endonuclease/helicase Cas3